MALVCHMCFAKDKALQPLKQFHHGLVYVLLCISGCLDKPPLAVNDLTCIDHILFVRQMLYCSRSIFLGLRTRLAIIYNHNKKVIPKTYHVFTTLVHFFCHTTLLQKLLGIIIFEDKSFRLYSYVLQNYIVCSHLHNIRTKPA